MRRNPAQQHRTGWSSGQGESAYRAASRRLAPGRVARRRRAAIAASQRRRRPLLFFALVATVAGMFAVIFADIVALVALFALTGLLLCAVVIRTETSLPNRGLPAGNPRAAGNGTLKPVAVSIGPQYGTSGPFRELGTTRTRWSALLAWEPPTAPCVACPMEKRRA